MPDDSPTPDSTDALLAPGDSVRLLLSTAPPGLASKLARKLVEEGLAACVNIVPGLRSIYRWKGQLRDEPETLLLIKTTADQVGPLAARLGELHPYETPELLSLKPDEGLATYLAWVGAETGQASDA